MTRYIGKQPAFGNFVKLDAISVVNGQAAYTMQSGSSNFTNYDNVNQFIVSLNGVIQAPTDSFTVSGSTITFASALSTGDVINFILVLGDVLSIGTPSDNTVSTVKIQDTAVNADKLATDAVQTAKIQNDAVTIDKLNLISTSSSPSLEAKGTSGQTDGYIQLNCEQNSHGIKLKSPPHSAAQSYTLTFPSTAPSADKILQTDGSGNLSFADVSGGTDWQSSVKTANFTAVAGEGYFVDTSSSAFEIDLPTSPSVGDQIEFVDFSRSFASNSLTLDQGSVKFQGNTSPKPVYTTAGQNIKIVYSGSTQGWIPLVDDDVTMETPQNYSVDFLVVAGGGGSSTGNTGGGGAGGYRTSTQTVDGGTVITVTVGDGGGSAGSVSNGTDSSFSGTGLTTITSTGGGAGRSGSTVGNSGGSGGGSGYNTGTGGSGNTPATTPSQGNNGGGGQNGSPYRGGGGGGAGGNATQNGGNGTANTGGGGGGTYLPNTPGQGGSGVVILSVPTSNYSSTTSGSPTVTTSGSNTIIKFTGSGSYTA